MQRVPLFVLVGVLGVAFLAGWLARPRPPAAPSGPMAGVPPAPATTAPPPPPTPSPAPRTFHWSQVESPDYLTYIANLRAIGCPEQTVRDIIVADVNHLFAPRYAALGAHAPELAWWGRFDKKRPVRTALAAQLRALNEEKKALCHRLLGTNVVADFSSLDATVATVRERNLFDFLPDTKQAAVRDLVSRYQALLEWSESQWKGLPTDEREAREKELRDARSRELAALLTPEEMREFDLRDSPATDVLREQYGKANLTEAEFRKLYELRRGFEQSVPEPRRDDWKRLEADYIAALGPERFADVQRQNDAMWRAMQELPAERALAPETMRSAYDIQREYTEKMSLAVGQMFADPQQNPQPLRDLAAEMDARLATVLGADTVKHLDRLGVLPRLVIQDDGNRKSYSFSRAAFAE